MPNLSDYISFNSDFKDSINLYLDLNKPEKINSYLPTKSSVDILYQYLDAVENNRQQATLLIGPYGKGKSHLLLLLLSILSMDKNKQNVALLKDLSQRVSKTDKETAKLIDGFVKKKAKFLPILIMSTQGDLNQAFMVGLNEALKREGLSELTPETYYTHATAAIKRWEDEYRETFAKYLLALKEEKITDRDMRTRLDECDAGALHIFRKIYPDLSSGSVFNPLVNAEVLPMYQNISDKLAEDYGYDGLYIVFDEFSKFIEGQDKHLTGNNMKLLQDVCELANSSKKPQIFFTMIAHKSIKEYGKFLSADTINQFTGIEGRIREVFFVSSTKNNYELIESAIYKDSAIEKTTQYKQFVNEDRAKEFYNLFAFSSVFTYEDFKKTILKGCYPLSPTSAYLLLNISEKVAQNERTLFTFISKDEQYSMARYVKLVSVRSGKEWIVNADLIYDYFKNLFKKDLSNEYVHNEWLNAEYALDQTDETNKKKVLKALAIITIVNKPEELPADATNLRLASGVASAGDVIESLEAKELIYKKASTNSYAFKTRATSELKKEIKKRKEIKATRPNITRIFAEISDMQFVLPKRYNFEYTMTRYFRYEYMSVEEFLGIEDIEVIVQNGEFCDGKILALYSEQEKDFVREVREKLKASGNRKIIILLGTKAFQLYDQVQEYEILQDIKRDTEFFKQDGYEVLGKEIPVIEEDLEKEISGYVDETFGINSNATAFFYEKDKLRENTELSLSAIADKVCYAVYYDTVSINHELINREKLSTAQIKKARKSIIEQLLDDCDTQQYLEGTSAEATIYRAIFVGTGITSEEYKDNVEKVVNIFRKFISGAGDHKQPLNLLTEQLTSEPFAMRSAVIPLYLTYFLTERNEDIVVYFGEKEVPLNADMILNMCESPKDYYIFISLEDIKKEKYLNELSDLFIVKEKNKKLDSRIDNLVAGMQKWFRALPQVTKNVRSQKEYFGNETIEKAVPKVRELLQSVEANPYEILFVNLPKIFGTKDYDKLVKDILELKSKLNGYIYWLTDQAAKQTIRVFDSKEKQNLNHTLIEWYQEQSDFAKQGLHSNQITSLMRCIEENQSYDDRDIVKRVIYAVTGMYIDTWNDFSMEKYIDELRSVKEEIETLDDASKTEGSCELIFTQKNGEVKKCYYEPVSEGTGAIMRNIISDTLEDFKDLSVNEKVAILLEMIEKELK